jgi:hypothetical protein
VFTLDALFLLCWFMIRFIPAVDELGESQDDGTTMAEMHSDDDFDGRCSQKCQCEYNLQVLNCC